MKKNVFAILVAFIVTGIFIAHIGISAEVETYRVAYPEGYRQWTHVKSMVIEKGHPLHDSFGGIHHIYANKRALGAMKKGTAFPDGSVLIFDLLEAKRDNNAIVEGQRKVVGVMEKDSRKFTHTGGWGFEGFKGDTAERVVSNPKTDCFDCHESQEQHDYVFSTYRK